MRSDTAYLQFGIRQVSDYINKEGFRGFRLNGKKILIKGGGWVDPMLLNADSAYEEAGIDYAVHMNLNTIRMEGFWGNNQHLYNLCDQKGILIMAGLSCQWEWAHLIGMEKGGKYSAIVTAEQNDVAARSWRDQILWLRNHPSIFLWMYGSDRIPDPDLERRYLATLKKYDTTRPALSSAKEHVSEISGSSAVKMRGPYDYVPPNYWYIDSTYGGAFGFNTETSPGPQIPVLESLKKMMPVDSLWPISDTWLYHAARGVFHNFTAYNRAMNHRLGAPENLNDYLRKAQYLNYEGMRSMFEAFEANRFEATGVIQWMLNSSWPKLWWQLYDYYLMPNAAFYGARKANEPIHIAYNYGDDKVMVFNNTLKTTEPLSATATIFNANMKEVWHTTTDIDSLLGRSTKNLFKLPQKLDLSNTWFLSLKLYGKKEQVVSTNFYVLSMQKDLLKEKGSTYYITPQSQYADLTFLQQLDAVNLEVDKQFEEKGDSTCFHIHIKNPSDNLAFMIHLGLKNSKTLTAVVPVFWDANYITLLPGEERLISGYCHTKDLKGANAKVTIDGWNIE